MANRSTRQIILGERKWKNRPSDVQEITKLTQKSHLLGDYHDRWYYFFSKVPLSAQAKKTASDRLHLVTLDDLFDL